MRSGYNSNLNPFLDPILYHGLKKLLCYFSSVNTNDRSWFAQKTLAPGISTGSNEYLGVESLTDSFNSIIKNTLNYNRKRLQIKPNVMISYSSGHLVRVEIRLLTRLFKSRYRAAKRI